jgi:hypothetical protein
MLRNLTLCLLICIAVGQAAEYNSVVYLWAGQSTDVTNAADFVAAIDFNRTSSNYGKIVSRSSVPTSGSAVQSGNEPHHAQLSTDKSYYVSGGLLSFTKGPSAAQIFVWRIDQDNGFNAPSFQRGIVPPGGCTDEFVALDESKFLVSQMCSSSAVSPGEMVYFDAADGDVKTLTDSAGENPNQLENFNPHGFARTGKSNVIVTDYIVPGTLLADSAADVQFQSTLRLFSWSGHDSDMFDLETTWTVPVDPAQAQIGTGQGFMDTYGIAGDDKNRAYSCGTTDQQLYLIDPSNLDSVQQVYDLTSLIAGDDYVPSAGIVQITADGKRMLMSYRMRYVLLFNIEEPTAPVHLQTFDFCGVADSYQLPVSGTDDQFTTYSAYCAANGNLVGTHYVHLAHESDEDRFLVVNYFLNFGLATFAGARSVHAFQFDSNRNSFAIDLAFDPNPQLATLSASPHAAHYIRLNSDSSLHDDDDSAASTLASIPLLFVLFFALFLYI